MARATSGPYSGDPNNEVWGWGSIHILPHNYREGSAHVLKADMLFMQSRQVPPGHGGPIGDGHTVCMSSTMTVP